MKTKKPNPYEPRVKNNEFPKFGKPVKLFKRIDPIIREVAQRETQKIPSLSTFGGSGSLKETRRYTGGNILGISTLHKSCMQPVFSKEQAIDNASMRR